MKLIFNYPDNNHVSISINETTSDNDLKDIMPPCLKFILDLKLNQMKFF